MGRLRLISHCQADVKYLSGRLAKLQRLNFWMEFILAATASSSAVAAFTVWRTPSGSKAWQILGGVAAILAVLKPLLRLTEKIRRIEEVITGYRVLEHDMKKITAAVNQRRTYDKDLSDKFLSALDRMDQLLNKFTEPEDKKLKTRCQQEVLRELPADHFYIPEGGGDADRQ